jgi:hypothetical protein
LVERHWGIDERRHLSFGRGAALIAIVDPSSPASGASWLYLADEPERGLGPVLVWADRHHSSPVHVLVEAAAPLLARQAEYFSSPEVSVWQIDGDELVSAPPAALAEPARSKPAPELVDLLIDAGLEIVVDDGIVRGEVNGLEVARIGDGTLEVGVGAADRELTAMLHGDLAPTEQLTRAVAMVRELRRPDAPVHPLNQLVPERWLRTVLCRNPGLIGLRTLRSATTPTPRRGLREPDAAVALGESPDGQPVVVACSVGVDVDLVPRAADHRAGLNPEAQLWLVVPERDNHPTTQRLAANLREPALIVTVPDNWRDL